MNQATLHWGDPRLLAAQLIDDERAVREAAHASCQERLAPRVHEAFRHGKADPAIFRRWANSARDMIGGNGISNESESGAGRHLLNLEVVNTCEARTPGMR